jgi:hypothetical protein
VSHAIPAGSREVTVAYEKRESLDRRAIFLFSDIFIELFLSSFDFFYIFPDVYMLLIQPFLDP